MSNTERRLTAAQKASKAIELRCRGVTWNAVAAQVGYSSAEHACRAVTNALAKYPSQAADELRKIEDIRLDNLEAEAWKNYRTVQFQVCSRGLVTDDDGLPIPDNSHRDRALNTLLRICESRRRLHGLDRPVRLSIESQDEDDALLAELNGFIEDSLRHRDVPIPDGMVVAERDDTGYPTRLVPADEVTSG